jgi:hypothetical protein
MVYDIDQYMYKKRIQSDQKGIVRAGAKPSSQKRRRWDYFIAVMLFQAGKCPFLEGTARSWGNLGEDLTKNNDEGTSFSQATFLHRS